MIELEEMNHEFIRKREYSVTPVDLEEWLGLIKIFTKKIINAPK